MLQPSGIDDDALLWSVVGGEYGTLAKTLVLTYQVRTLRSLLSSNSNSGTHSLYKRPSFRRKVRAIEGMSVALKAELMNL